MIHVRACTQLDLITPRLDMVSCRVMIPGTYWMLEVINNWGTVDSVIGVM